MLRRVSLPVAAAMCAPTTSATRGYRLVPHVYNEIEELAETQKHGRWGVSHHNSLAAPLKRPEIMANKLNARELRRSGVYPEKSLARKLSNFYTDKHGNVAYPESTTKLIRFTVVGLDGHPFHFEVPPMPEHTLNSIIDGSGMNYGHSQFFQSCMNEDCSDPYHGEGCMVNVDLDTLDNLPPPNRWEYQTLVLMRQMDRADVTFTTRFSCQIPITPEIDGGLFAMKQYYSRNLRAQVTEWGPADDWATLVSLRSKKVEPWAPILEEPTKGDLPITLDMLFATSYQDIMAMRNPNYRRKDGFHSKPVMWAHRV